MMPERYFEFVGGSSAKFWAISVSNNRVTVRFGRIGTAGQTQTKELSDAASAVWHAEKLIAAKTAKGYAEAIVR
jgi:predicted DNA-binding WGR domain protein